MKFTLITIALALSGSTVVKAASDKPGKLNLGNGFKQNIKQSATRAHTEARIKELSNQPLDEKTIAEITKLKEQLEGVRTTNKVFEKCTPCDGTGRRGWGFTVQCGKCKGKGKTMIKNSKAFRQRIVDPFHKNDRSVNTQQKIIVGSKVTTLVEKEYQTECKEEYPDEHADLIKIHTSGKVIKIQDNDAMGDLNAAVTYAVEFPECKDYPVVRTAIYKHGEIQLDTNGQYRRAKPQSLKQIKKEVSKKRYSSKPKHLNALEAAIRRQRAKMSKKDDSNQTNDSTKSQ